MLANMCGEGERRCIFPFGIIVTGNEGFFQRTRLKMKPWLGLCLRHSMQSYTPPYTLSPVLVNKPSGPWSAIPYNRARHMSLQLH